MRRAQLLGQEPRQRRLRDRRHVERLDDLLDPRDVLLQIVGHGRAVTLVLGVERVAVRGLARERVEDNGEVRDLVVFDELEQRRREAVGRRRVFAFRVDERARNEDEVRPVRQRHRVEQVEAARHEGFRRWDFGFRKSEGRSENLAFTNLQLPAAMPLLLSP